MLLEQHTLDQNTQNFKITQLKKTFKKCFTIKKATITAERKCYGCKKHCGLFSQLNDLLGIIQSHVDVLNILTSFIQ